MVLPNRSDALRDQYKNTESWRIRLQTHEKYTQPQIDFVAWTMKLYPWKGNERVLDVGCGPGQYYSYIEKHLPDVTYYGVDFSTGMLAEHSAHDRVVRASIDQLPYPDDYFDVVMANHVLYLAPNIEAAIEETRRVLKPGGVFIATTNSVQTMPQFRELFRRAILLVSPPGVTRDVRVPLPMHQRFALENGSRLLSKYYFAVVRHDLPGTFIFTDVEPIMEYLESTRAIREPQLPDNISWDQVMLIMREQITNLIASMQSLMVEKLTGVLMATNTGGFIEEFVDIKSNSNHSS